MTKIRISLKALDGTSPYGAGRADVTIEPLHRSEHDGSIVLGKSLTIRVDGEALVDLPPTDVNQAYRFYFNPVNADAWVEHVMVPNADLLDYTALVRVDPKTLDVVDEPEASWWAALENVQLAEAVQGPKGDKGQDGHSPVLTWDGTVLKVDGVEGPDLKGPRGESGPSGVQGVPGDRGPMGPEGKQGPEGERGPEGPQGIQGLQGPAGATGATGDTGPAGPQGVPGVQGPAGPAGLEWRGTWDADVDYVNDDAVFYGGSSWFAAGDPILGEVPTQESEHWNPLALQGIQGVQGERGAVGPRGIEGRPGEDGAQGPQGIQGPRGPQGEQGVQGDTGPEGPAGHSGVLILGVSDPIPTGTPNGTVIFRRAE